MEEFTTRYFIQTSKLESLDTCQQFRIGGVPPEC
jgi:hypothetical protein